MLRNEVTIVGRYAIHRSIASGGMATVHLGRLLGPVGFARTVALKRLHAQYASDPEFVDMLVDEARIAGRIQHPNVVQTLDVVTAPGELLLVMEYVHGQSLSRLIKEVMDRGEIIPLPIVTAILSGMLHGLHAAHEAKGDTGQPLGIIHRDVSPQNVVIGTDGVSRVLDFGVAKAANRLQSTRSGQLKGKLAYMAPEQLRAQPTSRLIDIYAAGVVLWEALTAKRLFKADDEGSLIGLVLEGHIPPPSTVAPHIPPSLDEIVRRCVERDPTQRFQTAREAARALEAAVRPALASEIGEWVELTAKTALDKRAAHVAELESLTGLESQSNLALPPTPPVQEQQQRQPQPPPEHAGARTMAVPILPHGVPEPIDDAQTIREVPSTRSALASAAFDTTKAAAARPSRWIFAIAASIVMALVGGALIVFVLVVRRTPTPPTQQPLVGIVTDEPSPLTSASSSSTIVAVTAPVDSLPPTPASSSSASSVSSVSGANPNHRSTTKTTPHPVATNPVATPPPSTSASAPNMYRTRW